MVTKFKTPPLAFMGDKKNMLEPFIEALSGMACYITEDTIFYDIFGGSGLLSHELKRRYPNNEVVWNDLDDFQSRLNMLEKTEVLRVKMDYRELILRAKERGNFFFILDPTYIQTKKGRHGNFFGIKDFLNLVAIIEMPFILFSSAKSEVLDFLNFCKDEKNLKKLKNLTVRSANLNYCRKDKENRDFIFCTGRPSVATKQTELFLSIPAWRQSLDFT